MKIPKASLPIVKKNNKLFVYSLIRKTYLLLTPEEWVRQQIVHYLHKHRGISLARMNEEVGIPSTQKRLDLIVFEKNTGKPLVIVECKHPELELRSPHLLQLVEYSSLLQPRYLWLSNFHQNFFWDYEKKETCSFPNFE